MTTANPYSPKPIRLQSLRIGQWVQRKGEPLDLLQIRQVWRHDKRVQLIRDIGDQSPRSPSPSRNSPATTGA
jgi:hypothetical protein